MIAYLLLALGLVLLVEGLAWTLAPSLLERALAALAALPPEARRQFGLLAAAIGAALLWMASLLGL